MKQENKLPNADSHIIFSAAITKTIDSVWTDETHSVVDIQSSKYQAIFHFTYKFDSLCVIVHGLNTEAFDI